MIGIIKYKAGNLASVTNALGRLGAEFIISDDPNELEKADGIIFPGVGHAGAAMDDLRSRDLDIWLKQTKKPVLGICLGMQLLYESSEEGETQTLGIIPGRLKKFDSSKAKVPHMGWNQVSPVGTSLLFKDIPDNTSFYFVHSYYPDPEEVSAVIARSEYGITFTAALKKDNLQAVQFHPEKSGKWGLKVLHNFLTEGA